jgi:hypothetical protein
MARIPVEKSTSAEQQVLEAARGFLNEDTADLSGTLDIEKVLVLHSEPDLEWHEALRIGGSRTPTESVLLSDYLQLFARLFPPELYAPQISEMIERMFARVLDDPEGTERQLGELVATSNHPDAHRALLKFYRLRQKGNEDVLAAALGLWKATGDIASEPIISQVVGAYLRQPERPWSEELLWPELVEAVWRHQGGTDASVALRLSSAYARQRALKRARAVITSFVDAHRGSEDAVVAALNGVPRWQGWDVAELLVTHYKAALHGSSAFQVAWATWVAEMGEREVARRTAGDALFNYETVVSADPYWAMRFAETAGLPLGTARVRELLPLALQQAADREDMHGLVEIGELYGRHGMEAEFTESVRGRLSPTEYERLMRYWRERTARRRR